MMPASIPWFIVFAVGVLATIVDYRRYEKTMGPKGCAWFFAPLEKFSTWGSMAASLFVLSNFYFAAPQVEEKTLAIHEYGRVSSKGRITPFVCIRYNGLEKQLPFPGIYEIEAYDRVRLKIAKGFWGFDVIKGRELIRPPH
jgi:hypothetical protein